jgi:nitrogen regulatory protein PII-like uncharacterized protein
MKKIIRKITGLFVLLFVGILNKSMSVFWKKEKVDKIIGKILSKLSALMLSTLIPNVKNNNQFDKFKEKLKASFKLSEILYDYKIKEETENKIQFEIHYCPFTEALKNHKYPHLSKYLCAGDFIIAKKNKEKWDFKREHSLGTDGNYCNHAYFRK